MQQNQTQDAQPQSGTAATAHCAAQHAQLLQLQYDKFDVKK